MKGKDDKEVAKKIVFKPVKTPAGTPSVNNSEGEDEQEHHSQAVYHFCREVHHGSRTPCVECTISTTLSGHRRGFVKRSLPDSGATISILGLQVANKMNLKIDNTKVRLTNASGDKMSVEGGTQLFLSVSGGRILVGLLMDQF